MEITAQLVQRLVRAQFPRWGDLPIRPVFPGGHDNRTFRLGADMAARLPSHESYAAAVEKELRWLPRLGEKLTMPIPAPLAAGRPGAGYPFPWTINRWIDGETATDENIADRQAFALDLAGFLRELQSIDAADGPPAGEHNFHRGGDLRVYDAQTREALKNLSGSFDPRICTEIWETALSSRYSGAPVWIHGDVAVGNLVVRRGRLCGVIDFGTSGVGDPACDYVMAWNFFRPAERAVFLQAAGTDRDMVNRARGWALWKALITVDGNERESALHRWGRKALEALLCEAAHHQCHNRNRGHCQDTMQKKAKSPPE